MSDKTGIEWTDATWNPVTGCTEVSAGFVNSMSDLFHDSVPDEFIAQVWGVMAWSPQHTFQVLTKRHARMRSLLSSRDFKSRVDDAWYDFGRRYAMPERRVDPPKHPYDRWPLPNVWLGVSAENQQWAGIRIPALLDTPAVVRFVSAEPLLGPIRLGAIPPLVGGVPKIDWLIVGGESGHGARPMNPDWARGLRDECEDAGVAFLFKQWGEYAPRCTLALCGHPCVCNGVARSHPTEMRRVGKKSAGRELDGRTWDQYPEKVTKT